MAFENNITNNASTWDIGTANATIYLTGKEVLVNTNKPATDILTNNAGTIPINGNLLNGGKWQNDNPYPNPNPCDVDECGDRHIINNGGSITITGKLTSTGITDSKGNVYGSQILIYGGSVSAGVIENSANSSIVIGADSSRNLG
ncbi:hypothetical protein [Helicobacter fennelliae]|uniref:hypothetical protein n=1 Tax=Helicobacter fennelliae TaxID=215 RepID=UPI0003FC45B4|nr:hypothetical protein [Helicobacter fennelliae]STP06802.1 Uncharacterised protein [Helicobacter fennelliae]